MKIAIITPSFNSADTLERAIESVLVQKYDDFEHIVVDGKSTDETKNVLKKYPHIKWISEPDNGQVDAMHKGFEMSAGDIIGNLNADDYYLPGAFNAIVSYFEAGEKFVMGKVKVISEHNKTTWINDPEFELEKMLKHWEPNAFCVNPVGYFYHREVQETIPFNLENDDKQDLEFLLEAASKFTIKKINCLLGVFCHVMEAKTFQEQMKPSYWQNDNFQFVEDLLKQMPVDYQKNFRLERERGYQLRRYWTIRDGIRLGHVKKLIDDEELYFLPEDEKDSVSSRCGFADFDRIASKGDWVIPVLTIGKVASMSICHALEQLPDKVLAAHVYHIHVFNKDSISKNLPDMIPLHTHLATGLALNTVYREYYDTFKWKFIAGVRDPISMALSGIFQIDDVVAEYEYKIIQNIKDYIFQHFDANFRDELDIDVYQHPFNHDKGYSIIRKGCIELLIYRFEDLPKIFSQAMEEYLGIPNLILPEINRASDKKYAEQYKKAKNSIRFHSDILDEVYSNKMVKHFYTDKEISLFKEKWLRQKIPSISKNFNGIIYDIGMHIGQDTEFYLKKGFRVIAVDANPALCREGKNKFFPYIDSGQLVILNVGIVEKVTNDKLFFYINEKVSEWSSFIKEIAVRDNSPYRKIEVPCMTLCEIIEKYGKPYYVKIDIEGHDEIALKSLLNSNDLLSKYISVENGNGGMPAMLFHKGYNKFKYIQQNNITEIKLPKPAKESSYIEHKFPVGASGPFGEETQGEWKCYDDILIEIEKVWDPDSFNKNPDHDDKVHGWFDLHAKLSLK